MIPLCALFCVLLLSGCGVKIVGMPSWESGGNASAARVVKTAQSQIGTRYRSGGTTPSGFDCSGLIWWAYRQNGVNVPRMTADQARAGFGVNRRSMRAGDILVFNTRQGRTGLHTGLYTGNGRFVHSPSSGKRVRQDSLSQEYWDRRLVKIRRILRK
ncbi:MAG: C40 family peptidase [Bilophila sp.]